MPGFGIDDDELKKLFAEAGEAVKKVASSPSAAPPAAPAQPGEAAPAAPPAEPPVESLQAEASSPIEPPPRFARGALPGAPAEPAAGGGRIQLKAGEQAEDALLAQTTEGGSVRIPWVEIRGLRAGRVQDRSMLAFAHGGKVYYFVDDKVSFKGLLKSMAATTTMNWRTLVAEVAERVEDRGDAGVSALTGGGGTMPRYQDAAEFLSAVAAR